MKPSAPIAPNGGIRLARPARLGRASRDRPRASDLTPELLEHGRRIAVERGLAVECVEADAEALPFPTGGFDVVISCVGVMFAPHHRAAADELLRVCRSGGTIALVNWTPEGFIGGLFATMARFAPPPPPGAQPLPLWGSEEHVRVSGPTLRAACQ
jgi:SAM-dependent methyltransferase